MLQKIFISNQCCSFKLYIHQRILTKEKIMVSTKIRSSTTFYNIENNKKYFWGFFLSIKSMISEGSCDFKDWRNNAENSALPSLE